MGLTPDPATQQPGTPPAEQPNQQVPPGATPDLVDWQARYNGQQRVLTTRSEQVNQLTGELETIKAEKEQAQLRIAQLEKALNERGTDIEQRETEVTTVKKEKGETEAALLRAKVLLKKEFRHLADFEEQGVLPVIAEPTEETLVAAFTKFSSALGQVMQRGAEEAVEGGTPPAPPSTPGDATPSKQQLMDQIMIASKRGDTKEFDRLQSELFKLG